MNIYIFKILIGGLCVICVVAGAALDKGALAQCQSHGFSPAVCHHTIAR